MSSKAYPPFIVAAIILLAWMPRSDAAVVFTAIESGSDVVVTGSGTLNLSAWGVLAAGFNTDNLIPNMAAIIMGSSGFEVGVGYGSPTNFVGPASFGTGPSIDASSGSGDIFGITETSVLFVPNAYVSGMPLAGAMTFAGQDFASLGVQTGAHTWSWGFGADADSITLNVVPEPSAALLFGFGCLATVLARRRRRGESV